MKKFIRGALLAGAAIVGSTGAAQAEVALSGNIALSTDYVFRGISQTQHAPAVSGGFDATSGIFYAGVWASNVDFGSFGPLALNVPLEVDVYAGVKPTIGPISADFGVLGYFYPGADEGILPAGEFDYLELKAAGSIAPAEGFTLGAAAYYSPEFPGDGGTALYVELNGAYTFSDLVSISGAVGNQSVDTAGYFVTTSGPGEDSYTTYNAGVTFATHGFTIDLRYIGNDVDDITNFIGEEVSDSTAMLTLKRAL